MPPITPTLSKLLLIGTFWILSQTAFAACTDPSGSEGDIVYNQTHKVMQFCNGTDWVSMASSFTQGAWEVSGTNMIYNNGNVGIGLDSPSHALSVDGVIRTVGTGYTPNGYIDLNADDGAIEIASANDSYSYIDFKGSSNLGSDFVGRIGFDDNGAIFNMEGNLRVSGEAFMTGLDNAAGSATLCLQTGGELAFIYSNACVPSDERLKKDIVDYENGLNTILKMRGTRFYWKDASAPERKRQQVGLIAQEVEKVLPEAVLTSSEGVKSVSYDSLIAPLIEAVKELNAENEKLRSEFEAYKAQNAHAYSSASR